MKKIFVAGHKGMVGGAICRQLEIEGNVEVIKKTRSELDLTDQSAVSNFFKKEIIKIAESVSIKILKNEDSFTENEWKELYKLSEETFVEENESLKTSGAGAGLTDND